MKSVRTDRKTNPSETGDHGLLSWLFLCLCLFSLESQLQATNFGAQRTQVLALGKLTAPPTMRQAAGFSDNEGLKAIYYRARPWRGHPTKVFAWIGLPKNQSGKVPGVVLVHGGGGTAFKQWVKLWNARGFAAISIAVEGQTDRRIRTAGKGKVWERHDEAGPPRQEIYGDIESPLEDQWIYHAVADTVLANSLLRSLPGVDPGKVGLVGISWGGVVASTVMGIDSRFAFVIPIYGCGDLTHSADRYIQALGHQALYREVWDPIVRMDRAGMPAFWFTDLHDRHFSLNAQAACYRRAPGSRMVAILPNMAHSHPAGWTPDDGYAFAESIVREGRPWCPRVQTSSRNGVARCVFTSEKPLNRAILISTTDKGFTGSRNWIESSATLVRHNSRTWIATTPLPQGTTAWFINAHSGTLTVSSEYQELP